MATSRIAEHVGRVLSDRYRLTRPLGTGASAHVYVAEDVTLRRRVAVKVLHAALADDEAFLRRFQAEARVVAALRHPSIVRVYDWGNDSGTPFLVMELLEGGSLRSLLDRGHLLSPAQAATLGAGAARALEYAHHRGLVHRDIKPANLLFDEDGRVSIGDFGLARALAEATWTEPVGAVLGTARYAAPEQMSGVGLDGKADVYALALVLVEAVAGKVPFSADTTIGTLMARVDQAIPIADELGPLGPAIATAGTAAPAERADAGAFAAGLEDVARQLPPPQPLALAGANDPVDSPDDMDLTQLPGRARLFDGETDESNGHRGTDQGRNGNAGSRPSATAVVPPGGDRMRSERPIRRQPIPVATRVRRRPWIWVAVAVVVAAVLTAGGMAASRLSKPSHTVPTLHAMPVADARRTLDALHLHLLVTGKAYDESIASDSIISQQPQPSSRLREGSSVAVVLSQGPAPVAVPDLTGLTQDAAQNQLKGAGLQVGRITGKFDATAVKGSVLSWTGQGTKVPRQTPIDLVVSNGPPIVGIPAVTSLPLAAAQAALAAQGLTGVEVDAFSDTVPKGQVISANPTPGSQVQVGSKVTLTVSKGPDVVPVSNVVGLSVDSATRKLQNDGFSVSGVTGSPIRSVTRTAPAVGASVKRGSAVTLFTN